MFASKEFIELSRKFVCVRIDSYESTDHQDWVRRFLRGRFANTAFCVLAPNGQDWLTRAGRSPKSVFGQENAVRELAKIARRYPVDFDQSQSVLQDFHSVEQALNVASADQRLLVLIAGSEASTETAKRTLQPIVSAPKHLGRFHVDSETGSQWLNIVTDVKSAEGIFFVKAGEFGLTGKVLHQLPLTAKASEFEEALDKTNETYVETTAKKNYQAHVRKGHRLGIRYQSEVPYGEDRNGDGQIDRQARRRNGPR